MATFEYQARNRRGESMSGKMDAETADRVAEQLFNSGITPVNIKELIESEHDIDVNNLFGDYFKPGVSLDELVMLCRQMRTLMRAGIPILRGLTGLAESIENPTLSGALFDIHDQLEAGRAFNVALAAHPEIFMPLFIALVRVGESTGQLDEAFSKLADYLEAEKETRQRIKSALRYPTIVIGAVVVAMIIINIWVVPVFAGIFAKYDAELPVMTQILLASSDFMLNWWPWILAGAVAASFAFKSWVSSDEGKYIWHKRLLKMPLIGIILTKATLGRFAQSLALVIKAGVPMVQGLTIVSEVVDNAYVAERVLSMRDGIEKGDTIAIGVTNDCSG